MNTNLITPSRSDNNYGVNTVSMDVLSSLSGSKAIYKWCLEARRCINKVVEKGLDIECLESVKAIIEFLAPELVKPDKCPFCGKPLSGRRLVRHLLKDPVCACYYNTVVLDIIHYALPIPILTIEEGRSAREIAREIAYSETPPLNLVREVIERIGRISGED